MLFPLFLFARKTLSFMEIYYILGGHIMSLSLIVANIRLKYHLNMIELVNSANQLHLISDDKADNANKLHLKNCIDCYDRMGYVLPKAFMDFAREEEL